MISAAQLATQLLHRGLAEHTERTPNMDNRYFAV